MKVTDHARQRARQRFRVKVSRGFKESLRRQIVTSPFYFAGKNQCRLFPVVIQGRRGLAVCSSDCKTLVTLV